VAIATPAQSNKKKKIYTENYSNTLSENLIPQPSLLLARDKKAIDSFTIAQHRARHTTPPTDNAFHCMCQCLLQETQALKESFIIIPYII
jgi:hypothetical protein